MTDETVTPLSPPPLGAPVTRLRDAPDWLYLLQEFEWLYRFGSAGGSPSIRSHRKRVRDTLSAVIATNPEIIDRAPATSL